MNQMDTMRNKQGITAAKKKINSLTRETIKNTADQQKANQINDNRNERMNIRSNIKQQKVKFARENQLGQMAKKRDRLTKQMREQIQREL
jgi:hypothetical protein